MTLDITTIKTLEEAKKASYAGDALSDADKAIFQESKFKKTDDSLDVTKLQATAKLLDEVKRANKLTKKDVVLLGELETAKAETGTDTPYGLINAVNTQIDAAITKLQGLPESGDNNAEITKALSELTLIQEKIKLEEAKIKAEEEKIEDFLKNEVYRDRERLKTAQANKTAIDAKIAELKGDVIAGNILKRIDKINKEYVDFAYVSDNLYETRLSKANGFTDKKYVGVGALSDFITWFVDVLREIDAEEFKKNLSPAASGILTKILKTKWSYNVKGKVNETIDLEKSFNSDDELKEELRKLETSNHYQDPKNWPTNRLELLDLINFMKEVFPENNYSKKNDGEFIKGPKALKGKGGINILEKEYKLGWNSIEKKPSGEVISWFLTSKLGLSKENFILKWSDGSLMNFFYSVFYKELDEKEADAYVDKDGTLQKLKMTEFESKGLYPRNRGVFVGLCLNSYVERIKTILGDEITVVGGEKVKVNFEVDGWAKAARKVAMTQIYDKDRISLEKQKMPKEQEKIEYERLTKTTDLVLRKGYFVYELDDEFKGISEYDRLLAKFELEIGSAESLVKADEMSISKRRDLTAVIRAGIIEEKEKEKIAKQKVRSLQGEGLDKIKQAFKDIYGEGPDKKKYTWAQLLQMESKLEVIRLKESSKKLNVEYAGYESKLQGVRNQLGGAGNLDLTKWMAMSGTAKERIDLLLGSENSEAKTNYLERMRDSLVANQGVSELSPREAEQLKQIKAILEETPQDSGLTLPILKDALKGTKVDATEDDYHLSTWKETTNFSEKDKIEELIKLVSETDGKIKDSFKTHLATHKTWGMELIPEGDDQWETFIKNEPQYIIGSVKFFHYENNNDYKTEIDNAIDVANSSDKADLVKGGWDKDNKEDVSQFIYKVSTGETGDALVKNSKVKDDSGNKDNNEAPTPWYARWGYWPVWSGGILVILGALVYIYWESIANWWNGPSEEMGEAEKTDEEERE